MPKMKKKEDMSIEELQEHIAKMQHDIDNDTVILNEKKQQYETKKFELIGRLVFDEMKNFKGNFFSLTPEILCKRLSDAYTKKAEKGIIRLIYSELNLQVPEIETPKPTVHKPEDDTEKKDEINRQIEERNKTVNPDTAGE